MAVNILHNRYGHLVVVAPAGSHPTEGRLWQCRCDCGNDTVVSARLLRRNGHHKDHCGCQTFERHSRRRRRHGAWLTPEYDAWHSMKQRCLNPKAPNYHRYGGRGIKIDPAWDFSFETFLADVGARPSPDHSLDRIDVHGDYTKANVRWVLPKTQANNRESTRLLTAHGKTQSMSEWSRETGIPVSTIRARLDGLGWAPEVALSKRATKRQGQPLSAQASLRQVYHAMVRRCTKEDDLAYPNYGGRGIQVCQRWLDSFQAFAADVGQRPSMAHSLDRISTEGGYEPGNVRWATKREQDNNRRTNVRLTARGETKTVMEWSRISGVLHATISNRIRLSGWDAERAIFTPSKRKPRTATARGLLADAAAPPSPAGHAGQ